MVGFRGQKFPKTSPKPPLKGAKVPLLSEALLGEDMVCNVVFGGIGGCDLAAEVGHGKVGKVAEGLETCLPVLDGIAVGIDHHPPTPECQEAFLAEHPLAASRHPDGLRKDGRSEEGVLGTFHEGDRSRGVLGEEVRPEEALVVEDGIPGDDALPREFAAEPEDVSAVAVEELGGVRIGAVALELEVVDAPLGVDGGKDDIVVELRGELVGAEAVVFGDLLHEGGMEDLEERKFSCCCADCSASCLECNDGAFGVED